MPRPIPRTWGGHSPNWHQFTPTRPPGGCSPYAGGGMSAERLEDFKLHVATLQRSLAVLLAFYREHDPRGVADNS